MSKNLQAKVLLPLCCVIAAILFLSAKTTDQKLPVITITTETALNAQQKVTAHMKTDGYDGPIGIKLRGNSISHWDRFLGMMTAMTQVPVPTTVARL